MTFTQRPARQPFAHKWKEYVDAHVQALVKGRRGYQGLVFGLDSAKILQDSALCRQVAVHAALNQDVEGVLVDYEALPFAAESADFILVYQLLEDAACLPLIPELKRCLRHDGDLLVVGFKDFTVPQVGLRALKKYLRSEGLYVVQAFYWPAMRFEQTWLKHVGQKLCQYVPELVEAYVLHLVRHEPGVTPLVVPWQMRKILHTASVSVPSYHVQKQVKRHE